MLQMYLALALATVTPGLLMAGARALFKEPPRPKPVARMSPAELWDLFAGLDADGSGSLDGAELGAAVKAVGAVAFTHPLGFLLLVLAASIGVYLCRGRRAERGTVLAAACVAANACAGARLAYYWNAFALVCSIPFFLTAAAAGRLHGAERRSFGAVSCLSILMLIKAAPFLVVAHILVGVWLVELWNSGYTWFIEIWNSGSAWLVERWDDVEYWQTIWNWQLPPPAARSRDAPLTSFLDDFFGPIPELCLWYAAITTVDFVVVRRLADGGSESDRFVEALHAMATQRSDVIRWDAARRALVIQRDRIEDVLVQRGSTWGPFRDQLDALGFTGRLEAPGVVVYENADVADLLELKREDASST